MAEAGRCFGCSDPACQAGCPLQVDAGAFLRRIRTGNWAGALRVLYERNPLPETCALICPVEVLCEGQCNRAKIDYPVRIADLQRAAAHYGRQRLARPLARPVESRSGRVAVVGGGPAGLACAARLAANGWQVELFEKDTALGGALMRWIPAWRLPRDILQREVQAIIDLGVRVHTGEGLGRDFDLQQLRSRFDAVFLAPGLSASRRSTIAGREGHGVLDALEFLEGANAGRAMSLAQPVVVIGGGNTAIDAAVTARHLGAGDVYLIYRRSFLQMPAWPGERHRAVDAGVHVLIMLRPVEYVRQGDGSLAGVKCVRTRLEPDASGRDRPVDVPGSEVVLPAGCVIEAFGQTAGTDLRQALRDLRWTGDGRLEVEPETMQTSEPGVFAGGDLVNGGRTAAQAMAEGLRAAESIERYVRQRRG